MDKDTLIKIAEELHLPSITLTSGESFTLRTATEKSFSENKQRRYDNEKTTDSRSAASDASVSEQRTVKTTSKRP